MARRELAERLLEELPDDRELTEEDMALITALLTDRGAVGLSYSTQNGTLYKVSIGGTPVRTIADLRQVVATLPPPKPGTGFAEAIAGGNHPPAQTLCDAGSRTTSATGSPCGTDDRRRLGRGRREIPRAAR